jgi:RNA polymerase sigma factor (sigma-70 family)
MSLIYHKGLQGAQPVLKFESFNEDYVRRLTAGDSGAGAHFAAYFGSVLYLKLRVRLRNLELIEDIRQETLLRVLVILREGEGVERPERFGAFVNGVCTNVARELCRAEGRAEPWDESIAEPIDPTVDLDAELVNADQKREIKRIFAVLQEKDRKILQALFLDEIDKAEVCRMFQVDASYLRVLVYRAKVQFRNAYRGGGGPPAVNPDGE